MSNLTKTGTAAFDYILVWVANPEARSKIETLLLDVERESFELGLEGDNDCDEIHTEDAYSEGHRDGYDQGYAEGTEDTDG